MSQTTLRQTITRTNLLQIAIIVLALVTALIHLDRAFMMGFFTGGHAGGPPAGHFPPGGSSTGRFPGGPGAPSGFMSSIFSILPTLFFLNFLGYIVLVIALYLPMLRQFQRLIRWGLIAFAAITIIGYFVIVGFNTNIVGYLDKVVEVALIILLLLEGRKTSRWPKDASPIEFAQSSGNRS